MLVYQMATHNHSHYSEALLTRPAKIREFAAGKCIPTGMRATIIEIPVLLYRIFHRSQTIREAQESMMDQKLMTVFHVYTPFEGPTSNN